MMQSTLGRVLLIVAVFLAVVATLAAVVERPKVAEIHLVTNDWASMGRSISRLRSFVLVVRESERFGVVDTTGQAVSGGPFVLRRILSDDSVEIGQYRDTTSRPQIVFSLAGFDSTYGVVVSHERVRIWTNSYDGGTEYYLNLDSVREMRLWEMAGMGSAGREATETERPDTSFVVRHERSDPRTGNLCIWNERLDSAHSRFVPHGLFIVAYSDGSTKEETEYVLGRRHGLHQRWYDNGQLELEGRFSSGKRQGTFSFWNRDGSTAGEAQFDKGNASIVLNCENGLTRLTGQYKDDYPWGLWREWHANGQIASEEFVGEDSLRVYPRQPIGVDWFEFSQ